MFICRFFMGRSCLLLLLTSHAIALLSAQSEDSQILQISSSLRGAIAEVID
ncbi:hypothetical protein AB3R30_09750 [Leptolyngbyaceae cyanobacterium UHCC 1019]